MRDQATCKGRVDLGSPSKSEHWGLVLINETPAALDSDWGDVVTEGYIGIDGLEGRERAAWGRELGRAKKTEIVPLWLDFRLVWLVEMPCEVIQAPYVVT